MEPSSLELKAWIKNLGVVEVKILDLGTKRFGFLRGGELAWADFKHALFMRYTDFKDRFERKIFEGDRLIFFNEGHLHEATVVWSKKDGAWVLACEDGMSLLLSRFINQLEVLDDKVAVEELGKGREKSWSCNAHKGEVNRG